MTSKKKLIGWGARIYSARAQMRGKRGSKMTQAELGQAAGVSAQQIGFYESETNEPSYDTWLKLAKALLMSPGELMFGNVHNIPVIEDEIRPVVQATRQKKKHA